MYTKQGFTLIEVVIGTALFLVIALAGYAAFTSLFQLANGNQARTLAVELADEQFEIIRNMPYVSVGLTNGIPLGILPQNQTLTRGGITYNVELTIRNINLSTSTVQASDKLVEVDITCPTCKDFQPISLTGQVSPANLQSASNGGALTVQAFNATGNPIQGATVNIQSVATSTVTDNDITNDSGVLNVIGVPQGTKMYQITVTKPGYSTDQTYTAGGVAGANPTKPNITVLNQQISQASFAIDKLSTLNFSSMTALCVPVGNIHFSMVGAKQIGTNIPKYSQNIVTNGSGIFSTSSMEWDTYTITPTDSNYYFAGINPISPFTLNPNNTQNVQLVVVPKNPNSIMVTAEDSSSHLPISGATIELSGGAYDNTQITGEGYSTQTDWSGGNGQALYTIANKYWADNGQADTSTSSGNIVMKQVFGSYTTVATATLESSTFDTGTSSNFYTFSWTPLNQPPLSGSNSIKFQFATNPTVSGPWNYLGPDGTAGTYFTVPGTSINSVQNGNEFARYLAYLTTNTATVTPMISSVSYAYTSNCIPPGQVIFQGLSAGNYTLTVSKAGYTTYTHSVTIASGWQQQTVMLGP